MVNGTGTFDRTFQISPSQSDEVGDDLQLVASSDGFDSAVDPEGAISDATPTRAPEDHPEGPIWTRAFTTHVAPDRPYQKAPELSVAPRIRDQHPNS